MYEETKLQNNARPIVFLIEEDDDTRPLLVSNLRKQEYRVLVAALLEDAHEWVSVNGHINADLLLINLVRKTPEEALRLGREFRHHAKYDGQTPLVIMPEKIPVELEGHDVNVEGNDWICYFDGDSEQLHKLLARLLNKS